MYYKAINKKLLTLLDGPDELQKFGVAAASSALATLLTYPIDTLRTRIALEAGEKDGKFDGVCDAAKKIFREEEFA